MTPREANADLLAEITALRDRLASLTREKTQADAQATEALAQKTATAEILRVISSSPTDVQPVFDAIASRVVRLCDGFFSTVWRYDGTLIHHAADNYPTEEMRAILTKGYPAPAQQGNVVAQAISEGRIIHVEDLLDHSAPPASRGVAIALGYRTLLCVPMLRDGVSIGAIAVARQEARPFSDRQIELVQTFADQAVIAVENVRLFNETKEALEQQTATSEILRVISSSPTDVQPVFTAMATSAARLCEAFDATIFRIDGDVLRLVAHEGPIAPDTVLPLTDGTLGGRVIRQRRAIHVADMQAETHDYPISREVARSRGFRTILSVPLLHGAEAIGLIAIRRTEVRPFTERQVELVKTFADQAVIAIENVRLFTETKEALDRQTATSEILRVISSSPTDVRPVFDTIAASATRLCDGVYSVVFRYDGEVIAVAADNGRSAETSAIIRSAYPAPPGRGTLAGRALLERRLIAMTNAQDSRENPDGAERARALGYRAGLSVPMMRGDIAIGVINVLRVEATPFTDTQIQLLQTFADQAVIAIENVRLFTELQEKNRALTQAHAQVTEALEQQTATSEILRVISSSPTDIQPVLDAVASSAARLCDSLDGSIFRVDGDVARLMAHKGPISEVDKGPITAVGYLTPTDVPIVRGTVIGRAIIERRAIQVADLQAENQDFPEGSARARRIGWRTQLSVPLLREGGAIGVIALRRIEARPFSDSQIALLQTFADQAVIAIENVRLFNETKEALERQTATSEILRVISSSPTDVQPVFDAVVRNGARLCEAANASLHVREGDVMRKVAEFGHISTRLTVGETRPITRTTVSGRAIIDRRTINIGDLHAAEIGPEYPESRHIPETRACLGIPLLRERGEAVGALFIFHTEDRLFTDNEIALLETFADQAVIAIENVRLFKELEVRNRDLTEALEQQTATSEVLRVISSTPTDVQPVFDAVAKSAARLCDARDVGIVRLDDGLRMVAGTGVFSEMLAPDYNAQHIPATRGSVTGRAITDRMTIHVHDLAEESEAEYPHGRALQKRYGHRTMLATPLLREGLAIGAISICRFEVRPFSESQIALLRTFADQAVIAIENVRLFKELEVANRELAVASQHKSEFLANMSHELRTPLNAIIGFSEVLSERMFGELNEKQEEYSKDIHASGQHLLSLINDILDLSKIEAGRMELELSDFHLPTALDSALTLVRERAGRRGIALQMNVDERLGQIQADERKLRQVVLNLLSNAIKFTPEGGRIEVFAAPKDAFVEVSVSDTGVGIAAEDQEKVFEEFRQVGTAERKAEGTGLGLTLCRKFVELHGGRIWVKSQVGAGSTFAFTIPVRHGE
jgi:GAF domain-containing protein